MSKLLIFVLLLAYFEVCPLLCKTWVNTYDATIVGVKAHNTAGNGYVHYDNMQSMDTKAKYVMSSQIGGAFIWFVTKKFEKNVPLLGLIY